MLSSLRQAPMFAYTITGYNVAIADNNQLFK